MPGTDLRIADPEDASRDLPPGVAGELCIRGPQVFHGYWQQPEETATMLHNGWLHTGDIAVMDHHGFVTIVDRKRDVINASGFSVFPSEIEDVLNEHPAVQSCAVVGVPHYYRGETVKAFVVLEPDQHVTEEELHDFCATRLVAYKVPARFEFRADLPRNILGKVLRRVLRAEDDAARTGRFTLPHAGYVEETPATLGSETYGTPMYINGLTQANGTAISGPISFDVPAPLPPPPPAPSASPAPAPEPAPQFQPQPAPEPYGPPESGPVLAPWVPGPLVTPEAEAPTKVNGTNGTHVDGGLVADLERLSRLHDMGALTDDEFHAAKMRLLS